MKKAFITGISGQSGSYLTELLESLNYEVHGLVRRSSNSHHLQNLENTKAIIHYGDITDELSIYRAIEEVQPDEVYNLAAQSFVKLSYDTPVDTGNSTGLGTMRVLEAIRRIKPDTKFYNAASSELFGASPAPQNEQTSLHPVSPYSVAKIYAYWATINYRETYGMFAVNGILFNHESPRRGIEFLSRKVAKGVADIKKGKLKKLQLGNLDAKRDWGHAKDYMRAAHLMMQYEKADDWVIGSGESHSVQEFVEKAFQVVNLDWKEYVEVSDIYKRPAEVNHLQADPSKARKLLNWQSEYTFDQLIKEMVEVELMRL